MTADLVLQALLSGIVNGFVYALIGLGLAVIFKGTRIVNAMQGEFSVVGAMVTVFALSGMGLPYWLAIVLGVLAGCALGVVVDVLFVRPMNRRDASEESYLLLTIGLAIALSAAVLYFGGRDSHLLPPFGGDAIVEIYGALLREHAIWLVVASIGVVFALRMFYSKTLVGLAMAASSLDAEGASTNGINVGRMRTLTLMLGGAVGALAGILVTPLIEVSYMMGIALTLKGFAAAIIGGLTNPFGAVAGGLLLGLLESFALITFPSGYKDVIALSLLIATMIFRPNGLLGRAGRAGG